MGSVVLNGATSGATTITPTDAVTATLTLPSTSGALGLSTGSGTTSFNAQNTFGFKNRIINGAMVIDQRYSGASQSPAPSGYSADRWALFKSGTGTWSYQLSSNAPAGFSSSMLLTVTATETPSSGDYFIIQQPIEGFNTYDLSWGTANAKTITLSAWVYSSVTGTFSGALRNSATTLSYAFSYSIPTANTWTQISVTILGPTTATWVGATNGVGIYIDFCLSGGSSQLTSAGSWTSGSYIGATGQTPWISTSSATFYLTGVQFEVGSQATSFDFRDYGRELILCQRYYAKLSSTYSNYAPFGAGTVVSTTEADVFVKYPVTMRGAATTTISGGKINAGINSNTVIGITTAYPGTDSVYVVINATASGMSAGQGALLCANGNSSDFLAFSAEL